MSVWCTPTAKQVYGTHSVSEDRISETHTGCSDISFSDRQMDERTDLREASLLGNEELPQVHVLTGVFTTSSRGDNQGFVLLGFCG